MYGEKLLVCVSLSVSEIPSLCLSKSNYIFHNTCQLKPLQLPLVCKECELKFIHLAGRVSADNVVTVL